MTNILFSWVGTADLKGAAEQPPSGPLRQVLVAGHYDHLYLLHNQPESEVATYIAHLSEFYTGTITARPASLTSPIHFADIYHAMNAALAEARRGHPRANFTIQLTSGTPAMAAVSILLGKAKYPAGFVQSSREQGVAEEDLPFDIAADFLPALVQQRDDRLALLMAGLAPNTAAFDDIVTQNRQMQALKERAAALANREVPVLIYGETGTGKELFAKAIKNASRRADEPFLVVNCGAIAQDLVDATLFGHAKGAFTGATEAKKGYFEQADGGTLFLDEFGELTPETQVRLLRVLQDGTFTPLGSTVQKTTNVRIIAATNRNLMEEVAAGRFREDLFYRVAIGVISLPPLRERGGDLALLADTLMANINRDADGEPGYVDKKISASAKNIIKSYAWPGNVRELYATLLRASLWQPKAAISGDDIREAIMQRPVAKAEILNRDISQGIDINDIISDVYRHYVERALSASNGSKSKAAELLGLKNYQTLSNWMEKYGIEYS